MTAAAIPLLIAAAAHGQERDATSLKEIALELRQLRIELAEYRLETESRAVRELQQELETTHEQRNRLLAEERSQREQLAQMNTQLNDSNLDQDMRQHAESVRTEVVPAAMERTRNESAALAARQAEITQRLQNARIRQQALTERIKALTGRTL